jgi:dUTP pyrophosphatase
MIEVNVNITVGRNGYLPKYIHEGDTGADIYSAEDYTLQPHEGHAYSTDIVVEIPDGFELQIRSKSGLAADYGIFVLNSPATIDSVYRGEIFVILYNNGDKPFEIIKGMKLAQFVLKPTYKANFVVKNIEEFSNTPRGKNGLGSTGLYYAEG